jgi:FixJ family two-component response regulator
MDARPRLLIVDDEPHILSSLRLYFDQEGFSVTTCEHPQRAIDRIRQERFEVALVDIKMPVISGVELLKVVKGIDPAIEVIIVTGYATIETAVECMKAGAYDYIMKPFEDLDRDVKRPVLKALERYKLFESQRRLQDQLSLALKELQRTNQDLRRGLAEFTHLSQTASLLLNTRNLDQVLQIGLDTVRYIMDVQRALIALRGSDSRFIICKATGISLKAQERFSFDPDMMGLDVSGVHVLEDVWDRAPFKDIFALEEGGPDVKRVYIVPLRIFHQTIGFIFSFEDQDIQPDSRRSSMYGLLASQLAPFVLFHLKGLTRIGHPDAPRPEVSPDPPAQRHVNLSSLGFLSARMRPREVFMVVVALLLIVYYLGFESPLFKQAPAEEPLLISKEERQRMREKPSPTKQIPSLQQIDHFTPPAPRFELSELVSDPFVDWRREEAVNQDTPPGQDIPPSDVPVSFRLTGIYKGANGGYALLNDRWIMTGEEIDGYRLTRVESEYVVLENKKDRQVLKIQEGQGQEE